ncbi:carbohydrate ABC transporter permease [Diplocloster modestus]|uniref:Carbohydrate ABC transporter permease n=1 Tax=Diplocloster modestus TaxID=2850322 RepID=A0ABS6KEZ7_9FIRM|nr:carbohydrate ABC transporter permease [Diplocloster modestus]
MTKKKSRTGTKIGLYLVYIVISIFFLYPVLWVLSYSFKTVPELFSVPPKFLPQSLQLDNYRYVIQNTYIVKNIWNSFYIVVLTILGTLVLALPASYLFSRFRFRLSRQLQFFILIFQMISPIVIAIPLYNYLSRINLVNNHAVLILIYIAISIPMAVLNIKSYLDTIPKEIDEAAIIDGCSHWQILTKIHIPTSISGIISVSLMIMVSLWGQFVVPFILLNDAVKFPVSVGLINLQSSSEAITTHYLAAACILGILPTTLIFLILQKYIVSAMTAGAVKG